MASTSPTPFRISIPDKALSDLRDKLALATFPSDDDISASWDYGAPLSDIKRLTNYWRDKFDWRAAEAKLNELPMFRAPVPVDGFGSVDVHFVWQKSGKQNSIPLLFVHGWPGSFIEVSKILPKLTQSTDGPAFDVVAPSLPNFGFSGSVGTKGFALGQYAETCHKLMQSLGYEKYVTQGGDWGFYITRAIGRLFPTHCLASHVNMVRCYQPTFMKHPILALQHSLLPYTAAEAAGLARQNWFLAEGSGYRTLQATKPQTLGYSLADSPVGMMAWIYEKLHDWTDGYPWTDDEVLTWISIYWFSTAGPAASVRIYYEATHDVNPLTHRDGTQRWIPKVPLGLAFFPKELGVPPKTWARTMGPVVYESEHQRGGHFAAWEQPDSIVADLRNMFGKKGPCAGIVPGKSGYDDGRARL